MAEAPNNYTLPDDFKKRLTQGYALTAAYPYSGTDGEIVFWRVRLDHSTEGKFIRPVHASQGDTFALGEYPPEGKLARRAPLYDLRQVTGYPAAEIWVVEGEKCTDALNAFFAAHSAEHRHKAVTSGGSTSAQKADWTPLSGRKVRIWPDNDASGHAYAVAVVKELEAAGAVHAGTIDCDMIGLDQKQDCVDWIEAHPLAGLQDILALPVVEIEHEVKLLCFSEIDMQPIEWLWENRIACGKLTVIAGHPGTGKSQITSALAAAVSRGGEWPGGEGVAPLGRVILLSAEDDPSDTIAPRLTAAGANLNHCHMLTAVRDFACGTTRERGFDLNEDIARLSAAIKRTGDVRLVIIDPISAYMGKIDSNNNSDIRGLLMPLAELAREHRAAVILVTHLNKSTQQDPIGRVIGSIGLIAAARAGYVVQKDTSNADVRYFVPLKNNIGNDRDGFAYTIESVSLSQGIHTSRVAWLEGLIMAQTILHPEPKEGKSATSGAQDFLEELLSNGPMKSTDVFDVGDGAGYSKASLQRARKRAGAKTRKLGMAGGWEWYIPSAGIDLPEDCEGGEDAALCDTPSSAEFFDASEDVSARAEGGT